jgi:predicted N-acetyltransferase YhbS
MEIRALQPREQAACISLWRAVWPGDNEAYFRRYFEGDVEWLPYYTQVAVDGGRIVSAVHVCKRTVACGDFRLQMGGVANVATLPEYRGRGLNRACLRAAIGVMEADAMDFALLFTGINGYYAKEGFATVPRTRLRCTLRAGRKPVPTGIEVRPAQADDLGQLFAIYDAYNAVRPIAVQRSPAYWRDWVGMTPATLARPDPPLVAVFADGRIAGYVTYQANFYQGHQVTEDYAHVTEYGALPDGNPGKSGASLRTEPAANDRCESGDAIALALLGAVSERATESGKRELHLNIALDAPVRAAAATLCESCVETVTESAMGRLLHRDSLLRSLLLEWNDRWIEAGRPGGELAFESPYGPVGIDAPGQFLRVRTDDVPAMRMSHSTLLTLIFGAMTAEQAAPDPSVVPQLGALFPPRDSVYWSADGF